MYLREMGSVELLSREGEIAIAKRIEAGREAMIAGLCESPLTFQAIIIWRDELNDGKIFLRDIIDLEATYAGPEDARLASIRASAVAWRPLPAATQAGSRRWSARSRCRRPPLRLLRRRRASMSRRRRRRRRRRRSAAPRPPPARTARRRIRPRPPPKPTWTTTISRTQMSLAAIEAELKPKVVETFDKIADNYKKLRRLQEQDIQNRLQNETPLSPQQERKYKKLKDEIITEVKSLRLNQARIDSLVEQLYDINKKLVSLSRAG